MGARLGKSPSASPCVRLWAVTDAIKGLDATSGRRRPAPLHKRHARPPLVRVHARTQDTQREIRSGINIPYDVVKRQQVAAGHLSGHELLL